MQLGDARLGKFGDNLAAFGRTLRRAGVRVDPARIALATDAALTVGLERREDFSAALEAVLVSREQDRQVFRELFDAFFRNPNMAHKLLAQLLPSAEGKAEPSKRRPRVREALSPQQAFGKQAQPKPQDDKVDFDAAMTASDLQRLQHADFNALGATEFRLVERLARDIRLPLPTFASRRSRPATVARRCIGAACCSQRCAVAGSPLTSRACSGCANLCRYWFWWMCRGLWSVMPACYWPFCTLQPAVKHWAVVRDCNAMYLPLERT